LGEVPAQHGEPARGDLPRRGAHHPHLPARAGPPLRRRGRLGPPQGRRAGRGAQARLRPARRRLTPDFAPFLVLRTPPAGCEVTPRGAKSGATVSPPRRPPPP